MRIEAIAAAKAAQKPSKQQAQARAMEVEARGHEAKNGTEKEFKEE